MGRVYSPEELKEGLLPNPDAQQEAARYILDQLHQLDAVDPVLAREIACVVYGSTVTGRADIRSDVDICVSVYAPKIEGEGLSRAQRVFEGIVRDAEARYGVYIEERVVAEEAFFQAGTYSDDGISYSLDPLYVRHLITVAEQKPEWAYGTMPLDGYREPMCDPHGEDRAAVAWSTVHFTEHKQAHMAAAMARASSGETDYNDLQRALELPKAMGRKAIVVCGGMVDLGVTDKQAMHTRLNQLTHQFQNGGRLRHAQHALQQLDADYSRVLEASLRGDMSIEGYQQWLRENQLPALEIAHEIAKGWGEVFEVHAQQVSRETGIKAEEALSAIGLYEKE